jgi:Glycosyltransferase like family
VIAFGCSITNDYVYGYAAKPGLERTKEPNSLVIPNSAAGSIFRSYNLIMDSVRDRDDLEALVLVHQDAEIVDRDFCAKVRETLSDPEVGVAGCVGALDVRSIAWWEGSVTWASFIHRYRELGGGDIPSVSWDNSNLPPYARTGEVDSLDGFVLAISPWAVRNIRFDEGLGQQMHGYDFDFCLQVREAGRKVVTADFKVIHHHSLDLVTDPEVWVQAHKSVAEKWEGRMPGVGLPNWGAPAEDWKERARRAEAEAGVTRLERQSKVLQLEAVEAHLERVTKELEDLKRSTSWRLTAPLRRLSRELRARRNGTPRP